VRLQNIQRTTQRLEFLEVFAPFAFHLIEQALDGFHVLQDLLEGFDDLTHLPLGLTQQLVRSRWRWSAFAWRPGPLRRSRSLRGDGSVFHGRRAPVLTSSGLKLLRLGRSLRLRF
jgi:hypothetical protein